MRELTGFATLATFALVVLVQVVFFGVDVNLAIMQTLLGTIALGVVGIALSGAGYGLAVFITWCVDKRKKRRSESASTALAGLVGFLAVTAIAVILVAWGITSSNAAAEEERRLAEARDNNVTGQVYSIPAEYWLAERGDDEARDGIVSGPTHSVPAEILDEAVSCDG